MPNTNQNTQNNECTHNCSTCSQADGCNNKMPEKLNPNVNSSIKRIYGIVSGKGGVGKSLVSSLLATKLAKSGLKIGILDADITGPSIPKIFGIENKLKSDGTYIIPEKSKSGIKIVSANLILEDSDAPVAWRGPVVTGAISQFFNMVNWGELDILLIDMPPGTSDVFLTVMQMIPVDGIISVSTPQDLVGMIVGKAIKLAGYMSIDVIGLVENMSYFKCPKCDNNNEVFGKSQIEEISKRYNINVYDKLPINPDFAKMCDEGKIEEIDTSEYLNNNFKELV